MSETIDPKIPDAESVAREVELPRPTAAPLVLAVGLTLAAAGVPFGPAFFVVGAALIVIGLGMWIRELLPGQGHVHEPLVEISTRPVRAAPGGVEHMRPGMPGYRLRLPEKVHPISAGLKGGLAGGVVMPLPALLWGLISGHGVWYPVNLLAGMVLPGVDRMTIPESEQFRVSLLLLGLVIHIILSAVIGLIYGVLLPTLPEVPRPIAWGAMLMPILWTGISYVAMYVANPSLPDRVSWTWFVLSQFIFGITMPAVVHGAQHRPAILRGVIGGLVGGAAMTPAALLWAAATGHGLWYPINLVAGIVLPVPDEVSAADLGRFHAEWFLTAAAIHGVLSMSFGVLFALISRRLPAVPGPIAWGGSVLPLIWTAISYGLMGVVNPVLQERVHWPWFVVSQFLFGLTAAIVVLRYEKIPIRPAGLGPNRVAAFTAGEPGGSRE